jgi:hypothetical protein
MTNADLIDLQAWSAAKRRYQQTARAQVEPWNRLPTRTRQMFYAIERTRGRIERVREQLEGPSS